MTDRPRRMATAIVVTLALAQGACDSHQGGREEAQSHAGAGGPTTSAAPSATVAAVVRGGLEVSDQASDGRSITVSKVVMDGLGGWIVIHEDQAGPERILGHAPVPEGVSRDVVVNLDEPVPSGTYWVMLHRDGGAAGVFEWPGGPDGPVRASVGIAYVLKKIQVSVS